MARASSNALDPVPSGDDETGRYDSDDGEPGGWTFLGAWSGAAQVTAEPFEAYTLALSAPVGPLIRRLVRT